jgi:CheY-like chemotaxis protein
LLVAGCWLLVAGYWLLAATIAHQQSRTNKLSPPRVSNESTIQNADFYLLPFTFYLLPFTFYLLPFTLSTATPTQEMFAQWVQEALNHLYDAPFLRTHPLARVLIPPDTDALQRGRLLRRSLLDAIEQLCPPAGLPAQSPDWRAYRLLELRYVNGLTPAEVMQQLAISRSYYFREQARMITALTDALWEQWQRGRQERTQEVGASAPAHLAEAEIARLHDQTPWEAIDPVAVLDDLRDIIESMAASQGAIVHFALQCHLVVPQADRVLLRQVLLATAMGALGRARDVAVEFRSFASDNEIGIIVLARGARTSAWEPANDNNSALAMCSQFMASMGGELHIIAGAQQWEARLVWPAPAQRTLLVIDDHQDFTDLVRRYVAGQVWRVVGAANGAAARRLLEEMQPSVILLDVMMPKEDGWEILMALRADERTRDTPIIICSIMSEPRLARSFGATASLSKPVTQDALLRALAPWSQAAANRASEH